MRGRTSGRPLPAAAPAYLALAAVAASLVFSFALFPVLRGPLALNIDPDRYGELARNIATGRGYVYDHSPASVVDRGPAYPGLLALLFSLTGSDSPAAVQAAQAVLHGLTSLLVFLLVAPAGRPRTALVAQAVTALHPVLLWYTARVWTETFFTFWVTLSLLGVVMLGAGRGVRWAVVAGVAAGIASLTKGVFLPWGILAALLLSVAGGRGGARRALLVALLPVLVVLPWTFRNLAVTGVPVPVHTLLGANMINGDAIRDHWTEHPGSSTAIYALAEERRNALLAGTGLTMADPAGDRLLLQASLDDAMARPLLFVKRTLLNAVTFWYLSESPVKSAGLLLLQLPLLAAVAVLARRRRPGAVAAPVLLLVLYFWAAHALVNGWARYSAPLVPAGAAALALVAVKREGAGVESSGPNA